MTAQSVPSHGPNKKPPAIVNTAPPGTDSATNVA